MPKFWRDEAIPFEIARSFTETGKLDVVVAPGVVEKRSYLTHATGFPVTLTLALFFKLFGVGIFQSRFFMIIWIMLAVLTLFYVLKNFFDPEAAIVGTLFVATFASFYANGRTSTGEIPGFFFLILALFLLYKKERYVLGGMFLALAAVTKPSIYLLVFPAFLLELVFLRRSDFFSRATYTALGAIPVFLFWILIIIPSPFSVSSWADAIEFYRYPFDEPSVFSKLPGILPSLIGHTTILYFGALSLLLLVAYARNTFSNSAKRLVMFTFLYGVFAFFYFMRSPGWLRFLIAYELLVLALLFPALRFFAKKFPVTPRIFAAGLILVQSVNFLFYSNILSGHAYVDTGRFINEEILKKNETIGFMYTPILASFIASNRKYQIVRINSRNVFGINSLALPREELPTYILIPGSAYGEYRARLENDYGQKEVANINGYKIFRKK